MFSHHAVLKTRIIWVILQDLLCGARASRWLQKSFNHFFCFALREPFLLPAAGAYPGWLKLEPSEGLHSLGHRSRYLCADPRPCASAETLSPSQSTAYMHVDIASVCSGLLERSYRQWLRQFGGFVNVNFWYMSGCTLGKAGSRMLLFAPRYPALLFVLGLELLLWP